ncbi:uncharacterized protein LDX57_000602 [Aspergillus melleus]|uniref:uncharacterized protein n=1 Tax=Aspergillus melleus TaxID=138277 RepID=UPI001E8ECBA8|nr:uncharacterized protein LDX57_000602 [Aspergillus melleus]KAH8422847.1 hypothetical protein LDX57_000602 [Aspergillus melleus]
MDIVPPSYQSATTRDAWSIIARYIPSSDLCAAALVCRRWHELFMPFLWGDPASHFGTDNDAVYVALTRFRRTLKYASLAVRMLTHTLHLPPALSEIYGGPRPEWLKEVLHYLPNLQSLIVSKLPFFDHNAMMALKGTTRNEQQADTAVSNAYNVRLLLADREPNTTSQGLAEALLRFPELVYLDLSYTTPARDRMVLSSLSQLEHLQVLKLRGIGLKDNDAEFLANAVGLRVRFLDLRENMLTDMAVRSLLQASFQTTGDAGIGSSEGATNTGTFCAFPQLTPSISNSNWLSSSTLDEQFVKALTQPLTGRSWVEGLSHSGITHLYIADNQITVEGAASLLASSRLHVLDVGTVDTVESLTRRPSSIPSQSHEGSQKLPGAEKLIPILGSAAKENLTYLRAHHVICTNDNPYKESVSLNNFLPELPGDSDSDTDTAERQADVELDAANEIHELPAQEAPIFELEGSPLPPSSETPVNGPGQPTIYEDEPLTLRRRGSAFAPEVIEGGQFPEVARMDVLGSPISPTGVPCGLSLSTASNPEISAGQTGTIPQCSSLVSMDDPRGQMIQQLLSKRPKNQSLPRRDHKDNSFPYLHPSHVPNLETLVLTDVPSHVPANSPYLKSLIRFITACSNEALLATLQAGSDYSLPPGRDRVKAEQERSRSLFALRRLVLEITPTEKLTGPAQLTAWKPASYHNGTSKSTTGDRDLENLWTASMDDFSFFDETECGIPENDPGKYFPMAALNEKVTLMPEDDSGDSTPISSSPGLLHRNSSLPKHMRPDVTSRSTAANGTRPPQVEEPEVDLVAELAAFRRAKKVEYEEVVRRDRKRRSTIGSASLLSPSTSSVRSVSPSPSIRSTTMVSTAQLSMAHFVEGNWKGEVKIVRNAAPKGRSGVVDMYGNYFEKGYLYP